MMRMKAMQQPVVSLVIIMLQDYIEEDSSYEIVVMADNGSITVITL